MREHAVRARPNECCGALIVRANVRWRIEGQNAELDRPTHAYRMDDETTARIKDNLADGWTLLAVYHSHLHGTPAFSRQDQRHAARGWWRWRRPIAPGTAHIVVALNWRRLGDVVYAAYGWSPDARRFLPIPLIVEGMATRKVVHAPDRREKALHFTEGSLM